jgi:hypothetical protein
VRPFLQRLESCQTSFAELKTEQLRAKTLETSEPQPPPPAPCDLAFYLVWLKKVLKSEIKK